MALGKDLLLVVFIHGFMGSDETFGLFPQCLKEVLSESIGSAVTECITYPEFETKGEMDDVVLAFTEWLKLLVLGREAANRDRGGTGKARVVLCGHSAGGLVAADALIKFVQNRPDAQDHVWPRIIACLAFDTPYLGLGINVARIVMSEVDDAIPIPVPGTSFASDALNGAGTTGAKILGKLIPDLDVEVVNHISFIKDILDEEDHYERLDAVVGYDKKMGILFKTFYPMLPADPPLFEDPRTFVLLPKREAPAAKHFFPVPNTRASHEIASHTGMFALKTNDGYDQLVSQTSEAIKEALVWSRCVTRWGRKGLDLRSAWQRIEGRTAIALVEPNYTFGVPNVGYFARYPRPSIFAARPYFLFEDLRTKL